MSVSIKPFCRRERISKNQTTIIQLRVTINRRSRYVSTGIRVPLAEWDFEKQEPLATSGHIKCEIFDKINSYQKRIKQLEAFDIEVTLDDLLDDEKSTSSQTLSEFTNGVIEQLRRQGKLSSAARYKVILTQLQRLRMANVRFEDITLKYIIDYEEALLQLGNKPNSIATKIALLKALYNKALNKRVFVCKNNPFLRYNISRHKEKPRKRAILKEDVLKLMEAPLPSTNTPYTELARDLFLFSYFSAGINFKDIAMLKGSDIVAGRIYYRRQKTGKEMNCTLLPQAQGIIDKYGQGKSENDYLFPILDRTKHQTVVQIATRLNKVLSKVNRELKLWGENLGLPTKLTTYVARHTYATVLKRSGVNIAIISESLGHSDLSTTQIYLDSFENAQIDEALKNLV